MHPLLNLHSVFVFPDEKGFTLINSQLGPIEMSGISKDEIKRFLPSPPNNIHYYHSSEGKTNATK